MIEFESDVPEKEPPFPSSYILITTLKQRGEISIKASKAYNMSCSRVTNVNFSITYVKEAGKCLVRLYRTHLLKMKLFVRIMRRVHVDLVG